jgi:hypothetical protein
MGVAISIGLLSTAVPTLAAPYSAVTAGSSVASSTNEVSPNLSRVTCGTRKDWLRFWNDTGELCFAGGGSQDVNIYNVYSFDTGNNVVVLHWDVGGEHHSKQFGKWFNPPPVPNYHITYIDIIG